MNSPNMRYGFVLPGGTAPEQLELAILAEQAGWDGIFAWEAAFGVDAWALIRALWEGRTSYHGKHYDYETGRMDLTRMAGPVQQRIPIWVVAVWPRPKSMRRVLRCDGIIPQYGGEGKPADVVELRAWLTEHGAAPGLDVICDGETPALDHAAAVAAVAPWAEAGCTWWLETRWEMPHDSAERLHQTRERLTAGPPRVQPPLVVPVQ